MSKALWFVIGMVAGDWLGRWLTHIVYIAIIAALLLSSNLFVICKP